MNKNSLHESIYKVINETDSLWLSRGEPDPLPSPGPNPPPYTLPPVQPVRPNPRPGTPYPIDAPRPQPPAPKPPLGFSRRSSQGLYQFGYPQRTRGYFGSSVPANTSNPELITDPFRRPYAY